MSLESDESIIRLAKSVAERRMSVRETEHQARLIAKKPHKSAAQETTPAEAAVEERLQRALGTKVRLRHRKGKGRIEVYFHSLDQLDALLDRIAP